jgi:hypothetical protein
MEQERENQYGRILLETEHDCIETPEELQAGNFHLGA